MGWTSELEKSSFGLGPGSLLSHLPPFDIVAHPSNSSLSQGLESEGEVTHLCTRLGAGTPGFLLAW
jgi:hypothetical protein